MYDNEVERMENVGEDGSIVEVYSFSGGFVGIGYVNRNSKIVVRILSRAPERIDTTFWRRRIEQALRNRFHLAKEEAFRVAFGEADGLPGLIVDKFGPYLVLEINTLGMDRRREEIIGVLEGIFDPAGVYVVIEGSPAQKEGLEEFRGWVRGSGPELIPYEINGVRLLADTKGQKTGAFLDQRENAKATAAFAEGRVCLDCFCYNGNFGMHLLKAGAKHVLFLDYSERAIEVAREVARLNGFTNCEFHVSNAFDFLKSLDESGAVYDLIVLDPPSFAKSSASRDSALRAYKEINYRSMRLLRNGGILATSSCTQVIALGEFEQVVVSAAIDAKLLLRLLYRGGQPLDHPEVYNVLETMYLKFLILQVSSVR